MKEKKSEQVKIEKMDSFLKSVKPAVVEVPSHKANLRRMLLNSKVAVKAQPKANLNAESGYGWNEFFKLAVLPATMVAIVGVGVVLLMNSQKTIKTDFKNGVQAIPNVVSNDIAALDANNIALVKISDPVITGDAVNLAQLTSSVQTNINLYDEYTYTKYYDSDIGLQISIPSGFGVSRSYYASSSAERFDFTYTGHKGVVTTSTNESTTEQDKFTVTLYKVISLISLTDGTWTPTSELKTIGGIEMQKYNNSDSSSSIYVFLGSDGFYHAIGFNIIRNYNSVVDGGFPGDSQAQANADITLYNAIFENILKTATINRGLSLYTDEQGGYSFSIPLLFNDVGTSQDGNVFWTVFKFTGRYGYENDSMVVQVIQNFDELVAANPEFIETNGLTTSVNGVELTIYTTNYTASYEMDSKYYAFTGGDGMSYALYVRASRTLNYNSGDFQGLVDYEKIQYEQVIANVLSSLTVKITSSPTIDYSFYDGDYSYDVTLPSNLVLVQNTDNTSYGEFRKVFIDRTVNSAAKTQTACTSNICGLIMQRSHASVTAQTGVSAGTKQQAYARGIGVPAASLKFDIQMYKQYNSNDYYIEAYNSTGLRFTAYVTTDNRTQAIEDVKAIITSLLITK